MEGQAKACPFFLSVAKTGTAHAVQTGMKTKLSDRCGAATVLICTPDTVLQEQLTRLLEAIGGYRVTVAVDAATALKQALQEPPELLVCSHEPMLFDGIALVTALRGKVWVPVVMATQNWSPELAKAAVAAGVAAFLTSYPTQAELTVALLQARLRLEQEDHLQAKVLELEQRLADRKVIEKAKGLLMAEEQLTEDAAFKRMRSQSMARRISMAKLAEELITKTARPDSP